MAETATEKETKVAIEAPWNVVVHNDPVIRGREAQAAADLGVLPDLHVQVERPRRVRRGLGVTRRHLQGRATLRLRCGRASTGIMLPKTSILESLNRWLRQFFHRGVLPLRQRDLGNLTLAGRHVVLIA